MAIELTTSIDYTQIVTTQEIESIFLLILARQVEYKIIEMDSIGNVLKNRTYIVSFDDIPDGVIKNDFKDVYNNIVTYARDKGQLMDGVDTNPI